MKSLIKVSTLAVALSAGHLAQSMGSSKPKPPVTQPSQPSQPTQPSADALIDLGLSFAIVYAKNDKRYAPILTALNINTPQDLKSFLIGNENGTNLQGILARLVFLKAQSDPEVRQWMTSLGITDEKSLREFLKTAGTSQMDFVFEAAYKYASSSNSKYTVWLQQLNIRSADDLRRLLQGRGDTLSNLRSLLLVVGLNYINNNPKYEKNRQYIEVAMVYFGVYAGSDGTGSGNTSDDDIINLGPYNGMTVGEVKAVRQIQ